MIILLEQFQDITNNYNLKLPDNINLIISNLKKIKDVTFLEINLNDVMMTSEERDDFHDWMPIGCYRTDNNELLLYYINVNPQYDGAQCLVSCNNKISIFDCSWIKK